MQCSSIFRRPVARCRSLLERKNRLGRLSIRHNHRTDSWTSNSSVNIKDHKGFLDTQLVAEETYNCFRDECLPGNAHAVLPVQQIHSRDKVEFRYSLRHEPDGGLGRGLGRGNEACRLFPCTCGLLRQGLCRAGDLGSCFGPRVCLKRLGRLQRPPDAVFVEALGAQDGAEEPVLLEDTAGSCLKLDGGLRAELDALTPALLQVVNVRLLSCPRVALVSS